MKCVNNCGRHTKAGMCLQCREEIIYEGSKKLSKLYGVRHEKYRIHIVASLKHKADMAIEPGPIVQIYLTPALIQPKLLRMKLNSAFAFIAKHNLVYPVEIVSYGYILEQNKKHERWVRTVFGDAIADLVPRASYRAEYETVQYVTLKHVSGISVTVSGTELRHTLEQQARMELSRLVLENNHDREIATLYNDEGQSTTRLYQNGSGENVSREDRGQGNGTDPNKDTRIDGSINETYSNLPVPIGLIIATRFDLECAARGLCNLMEDVT